MCPPCVSGSYYPNRACTLQGTCLMDHRARNALCHLQTHTRPPVPVAARANAPDRARQMARGPITRTRWETTQTATPTQRPDPSKRTPTKNTDKHRATFGPPGGNSPIGEVGDNYFESTKTRRLQKRRFKVGFRVRKSRVATKQSCKSETWFL